MAAQSSYGSSESLMDEGLCRRRRPSCIAAQLRWLKDWMLPGLGMFSNAYTMLAVGNIHPILEVADPHCWDVEHDGAGCTTALRDSVRYAVFVGLTIGMVAGGILGDKFGRRKGLITTATLMLIGSILIVCSAGPTVQAEYTWYVIALAIFGLGVGGEYPLSAVASAEKAAMQRKLRLQMAGQGAGVPPLKHNRGQAVSMSFSMQGLGNWTNTLVIVILLLCFQQMGPSQYDAVSMSYIWRIQYAIGTLIVAGLVYYRYRYLEESAVWLERQEQQLRAGAAGVGGNDSAGRRRKEVAHFFRVYWPRLIGTAGGWFMWDLTFYGNKVFQTQFIDLFVKNPTILTTLGWALLNATIGQVGYWLAAATMDKPWLGRRRLQLSGFFVLFAIFTLAGALWDYLREESYLPILQLLYFATTFFGQWGPNATTWIFPSEVYPTDVRAVGHALSGAAGKIGALVASVAFSLVDSRVRFLMCGAASVVGLGMTYFFLPDVGHMELSENDEFWDHEKRYLHLEEDQLPGLPVLTVANLQASRPGAPPTSPTRHYDGRFQAFLSPFEKVLPIAGGAFSPSA